MSAQGYREPENVDEAWLEEHVEVRREAWSDTREQLRRERNAEREAMPLHRRLARVTNDIAVLATAKAGSITSSARGADTNYAPPHADDLALGALHREVVARKLRLITKAIEELERAYDTHMGLVMPSSTMIAEEKDRRIITEFRGFPPEDVSALAPELGDPLVIRRVRHEHGRDPETGSRA